MSYPNELPRCTKQATPAAGGRSSSFPWVPEQQGPDAGGGRAGLGLPRRQQQEAHRGRQPGPEAFQLVLPRGKRKCGLELI